MSFPNKSEILSEASNDDRKPTPEESYLKVLESKIRDGLPFGEAIFSINIDGDDSDKILKFLNDTLDSGGYTYTYDYEKNSIGGSHPYSYGLVNYHIPLGTPNPRLCDGCGARLKNVDFQDKYLFDNALWLGFFGGFGMFFDDLGLVSKDSQLEAPLEALLCHDCANKFLEVFPRIKNKFLEGKSPCEVWHSHEGPEVEQLELF